MLTLYPNPPPNSGSRLPRKARRLRCLHRFDAQRSSATPALKSARCLALNLSEQPLFSDQAMDLGSTGKSLPIWL